MTSPVWTSRTMPVPPSALIEVTAVDELGFHHRLDAAVDRQGDRIAALGGIEQAALEHLLHAADAAPAGVGPADDMAGQRGLRIEPLGLAAEDDAGLAERR